MKRSHIASLAALSLLLAGCPSPAPQGVSGNDTIKIGYMNPLTGDDAAYGQSYLDAVRLAVQHVNAAGGVNGKPLEVLIGDDQGDPDTGVTIAQDLLAKGSIAIVGPGYSGVALKVVQDVLKPANVAAVSPSAATTAFSQVDDGGFFFRTVATVALDAKNLFRLMRDDGNQKLGVLYRSNAYGTSFADAFIAAGQAEGVTVTRIAYADSDNPDYNAVRSAMVDRDAVAMVSYPGDGGVLINDYYKAGDDQTIGLKWYYADSMTDYASRMTDVEKPRFEGSKGVTQIMDSPYLNDFKDALKAKSQVEYSSGAEAAYDATMLIALSLVKGGVNQKQAVTTHMVDVSVGGTKQEGWGQAGFQDAVAKLKAGIDLDYDGVSGHCDLDATGDRVDAKDIVWQWQDGKMVKTGPVME
jgi:branched-chain amino acid transport system substrate-binding protein